MTLPSSIVVGLGGADGVVFEGDGGKTITKARFPLFGEVNIFRRYFSVWATETCGLDLRSEGGYLVVAWCRILNEKPTSIALHLCCCIAHGRRQDRNVLLRAK